MNTELPIVVLASRWRWGVGVVFWAGVFAFFVYALFTTQHNDEWLIGVFVAVAGFLMLRAGWYYISLPPRIIIDKSGVGGRFIGGGFVGTERIAWEDITRARHLVMPSRYRDDELIVLDVNNADGKYRPASKFAHKWRTMIAWLETKQTRTQSSPFAFHINNAQLNHQRTEEIVMLINRLAKGVPEEQAGMSSFAADAIDDTLPIVILPSRQKWVITFLLSLAMLSACSYALITFTAEEIMSFPDGKDDPSYFPLIFLYLFPIAAGLGMLRAAWNIILLKPRLIIDEAGVGGRFINGDFVGMTRIAFDDIIGAQFQKTISKLVLYVDNKGGKYYRKSSTHSPKAGWHNKDDAFAFDLSRANISKSQASEVAAIISKHAKAKPPDKQESGKIEEPAKSPFAAG